MEGRMTSISEKMAEFAHQLEFDEIPGEAVHEAKRFLLDSLGCAFAASSNEDMAAMHRYIEVLGGVPEATVIGSGHRTNAPNAALMNGLLIRALDYNDIYWEQDPSHPSDLLGAVLAAAEANDRDGKDLVAAIVIAYELEMRWCHAAEPGIREVGWHHASLTQFVSPLVCGKLYGLDRDQLTASIGISGSSHFTLGGVVAGHLTNMKNTADPLAAQAGLHAVLMAREGYTGPVEVLEGKEGLFEVLSNVQWNPDELLRDLGHEFIITRCSYKAFPTEALTHQPISALISLCQEHKLDHTDIESILIETTTRGADILSDPSKFDPQTKETADHSLPYVIAVAAVRGNVLPEAFSDEVLWDPNIRSMLKKIQVTADPEIDRLFPGVKRARVSVETRDGQTFTNQTDYAKGSPENPMPDEEVIDKFTANSVASLDPDRCSDIVESVFNLEQLPSLEGLIEKLVIPNP
jgi:2-methylcitrate dehydratase